MRTNPDDRQRILVTEAQAERLEEQWALKYEYSKVIRCDRPGFEAERELLAKKFGGPPSDADVTWGLLNKERLRHGTEQKWGLYRNATLDMGDVLRMEGRTRDAVRFYLEVCYLDLNNPTNYGPIKDAELLARYPRFSPDPNGLASGVLSLLASAYAKASLTELELYALFMEQASMIHQNLGHPMSPGDAWPILREKLLISCVQRNQVVFRKPVG